MTKIDNIISIIMVFVTAFSYASSEGYGPVATLFTVAAGIILFELIVSVANSNPSIRTMLYVTVGFIFGLTLTMVLKFSKGWLSALICVLCMGYKYFVAEAVASKRSKSKNIFVIVVNAFFYSTMFTVIECMMFSDRSILFLLLYVVSFAFFMCCYIIYKSVDSAEEYVRTSFDNEVNVNASGHTVSGDWQHILKRSKNYSKIIGKNVGESVNNALQEFDKVLDAVKKKIGSTDKKNKGHHEYVEIKRTLLDKKRQIEELYDTKDLTDNELGILKNVLDKYRGIIDSFNSEQGLSYLECEAEISELTNQLEMLKNTINIRRMRDKEDEAAAFSGNKRSQAQQARRKREREERERQKRDREREEQRNRENQEREDRERREQEFRRSEEQRRAEEEKSYWEKFNEEREEEKRRKEEEWRREEQRREEERKQEEKRRREQEKSKTNTGSSENVEDSKYFKGCTNLEELSFRYKKLCLIYHPDNMNGNADTYIELKDEYEKLKKRLKNAV